MTALTPVAISMGPYTMALDQADGNLGPEEGMKNTPLPNR
jgi:hypothetical protein